MQVKDNLDILKSLRCMLLIKYILPTAYFPCPAERLQSPCFAAQIQVCIYVSEVSWLTNLTQSLKVTPRFQNEPVRLLLLKVLYTTGYVLLKNSDVTHLPLGTMHTFIASAAACKAEQDMNNHFLARFVQL